MTGNWQVYRSSQPSITISGLVDGQYEFEVVAIDAFGNRSPATQGRQGIDTTPSAGGEIAAPLEAVQNVALLITGEYTLLATWTPGPDDHYVQIRHSSDPSGGWTTARRLISGLTLPTLNGSVSLPLLTGCYLFRHFNEAGNQSALVFRAQLAVNTEQQKLTALTYSAAASLFAGEKTNCEYDAKRAVLRLTRTTWDELSSLALNNPIDSYGQRSSTPLQWDQLPSLNVGNPIDSYGLDDTTAVFTPNQTLTLNNVYPVEIRSHVYTQALFYPQLWDQIEGLVDEVILDEDGWVELQYRCSQDSTAQNATWSEWKPLFRSFEVGRIFEFRCILKCPTLNQDVTIKEIKVEVLLPQVIETLPQGLSQVDPIQISYRAKFYQLPSVGVTLLGEPGTAYFVVDNPTVSGFRLQVFNGLNQPIEHSFSAHAIGYGRPGMAPYMEANQAANTDALWDFVSLLLPLNGEEGSNVIEDVSSIPKTVQVFTGFVTRNLTTYDKGSLDSTATNPFALAATAANVSAAGLPAIFTLEASAYRPSASAQDWGIFRVGQEAAGRLWIYFRADNKVELEMFNIGVWLTSSVAAPLNQNFHLGVHGLSNGDVVITFNGTPVAQAARPGAIGNDGSFSLVSGGGHALSQIRVTQALTPRYSIPFAPPARAHPEQGP